MPRRHGHKNLAREIGTRVRVRRMELQLSQAALGKLVGGISFQQIQKYEKGSNMISAEMALMLSKALKVSVNYLLNNNGDGHHPNFSMLAAPGAIKLLTSFSKIGDPKYRQKVLKLAEAFALE